MAGRFAHPMPWGAELRPDGAVRFRLWAPSLPSLAVALGEDGPVLPMQEAGEGWYELVTDAAGAGTPYQFLLPDGLRVPDPASRGQQDDISGPSRVIDPRAYEWQQADWAGRPWEEAVWYELHVGCYSAEGSFDGLRRKLDHLADLGVAIVELMPIADFPGRRNWGYDGALLYAPDATYGRPEDLKRLIDEAHARGLMVFLDVVYNHFGPEGNFLGVYAKDFFNPDRHTPWGGAINYDLRPVRDYAIHNALYWLQEYRFDGLRLDAVDHIIDAGDEHLLKELARRVHETVGPDRHVHLVVENGNNEAHLLDRDAAGRPVYFSAQWNDDIHHCYHVLLTADSGGYYADYAEHTIEKFAKALCSGFVFQGEPWRYGGGKPRGEPSGHLPLTAFVGFIQNHDQIGNRAFGERIADMAPREAVETALAVHLLAPQVPLLFMGEEWGATQPFCFFTDFHDALADAVREGRRREFAKFPQFADPEARARIPDPNALSTFEISRLDWSALDDPAHRDRLELVRRLIRLRREAIVPRLRGLKGHAGESETLGPGALRAAWTLGDGSRLTLLANFGAGPQEPVPCPEGEPLFETRPGLLADEVGRGRLPGWSALWLLRPA